MTSSPSRSAFCFSACLSKSRCASRGLRLDKKEGLFPGPNHPGENHQEKPIGLTIDGSFDLSTEDDQLVSKQGVFRKQIGFSSGQIGECARHKGGRQWFDPPQNTFLERVQAKTDALLDRGKYIQHGWNLFFVKIGAWSEHTRRMNFVDCTRIPRVLARKLAPLCKTGRFPEQMSQVASTAVHPGAGNGNEARRTVGPQMARYQL